MLLRRSAAITRCTSDCQHHRQVLPSRKTRDAEIKNEHTALVSQRFREESKIMGTPPGNLSSPDDRQDAGPLTRPR